MPTLNWIGKEAVVKHHKEAPFRLLEPIPELSCAKVGAGGTAADEVNALLVEGKSHWLAVARSLPSLDQAAVEQHTHSLSGLAL